MTQKLTKILAHTLNVIEYGAPLRRRIWLRRTISSHGDRELHPRIPRIVVNNVQFSFRICVVEASLQSIEQVLVEEL